MILIKNTEVIGFDHAIRGMRNPKNSWDKSDSGWVVDFEDWDCGHGIPDGMGNAFVVGDNDLDLANRLSNAGTDHRKYMRMITVYLDITAPLYWWKEFDTYKVGTVANSCSTMHTIHEKEFTLHDFSCEHLMFEKVIGEYSPLDILRQTILMLNVCRQQFLDTKNKKYWWQMIQLLPSSYNQKRTIQLNYEVLANMYHSRRNHKLDEWRELCKWIEGLPYSEIITGKCD